jgi:hypothetical protein
MLSKLNRTWVPVDLYVDRSRVTAVKVVWAGFVLSRVHKVVQAPLAVLACTFIWSVWPLYDSTWYFVLNVRVGAAAVEMSRAGLVANPLERSGL